PVRGSPSSPTRRSSDLHALASPVLFRINSTDITCKVFSVMEIIFTTSEPSDNPILLHRHIPLRNRLIFAQTFVHAFRIFFKRNPPFFVKPLRSLFFYFRLICQSYNLIFHLRNHLS